jgi:hypothetical protein
VAVAAKPSEGVEVLLAGLKAEREEEDRGGPVTETSSSTLW